MGLTLLHIYGAITSAQIAWTAFVLISVTAVWCVLFRRPVHSNDAIPGYPGWPLLHDDIYKLLSLDSLSLKEWIRQRHQRFGEVVRSRFAARQVVHVVGVDNIRRLLGSQELVEANYPPTVKSLLGRFAILTTVGPSHLKLRRTLLRLFTLSAIRSYLPGIQHIIHTRLEQWAQQGGMIKAGAEAKEMTFDVLMRVVMGVDPSEAAPYTAPHSIYDLWKVFAAGLFCFPLYLPGTKWWKAQQARQVILKFVTAILTAKREAAAAGDGSSENHDGTAAAPPAKMIADLLAEGGDESSEPLSLEQQQDICITMMFAGHDSTAAAMSAMMWLLAAHPEALQKLRDEQRRVVEVHGGAISDVVMKDMEYTERVVKEVLRFWPIFGGIPRVALREFQIGGYTIKKGTRMTLGLFRTLHTIPGWEEGQGALDPGVFNPDRWLQQDTAAKVGWVMFGHGPRMCLGWPLAVAELKVLAALLARGYEWELLEPTEKWSHFPVPSPANGLPITFNKLKQK